MTPVFDGGISQLRFLFPEKEVYEVEKSNQNKWTNNINKTEQELTEELFGLWVSEGVSIMFEEAWQQGGWAGSWEVISSI